MGGQAQTIIYVTPDGSGNGSSWANASGIEHAITTAPEDSEIRLREGTYAITTTLLVTRRLTINGGYTGVGTNRNITTNPSVLDGGGNIQIMEIDAAGVAMDGLTFLAGFAATGADVNDGAGGGAIYISSNGVTITNSIFRNNVSAHRIGSGAIYLWSCDDIQIADCLFENNSVVENVSTVGNMGGGAMHIRFGNNTRIVNTVFRNNDSRYTGGAVHDWGENTQFENCVFEDNRSDENGGGLFIRADFTLVNNCRFERNQAVDGGGVYLSNDSSHFSNSIFRNNQASNNGGGLASNFGGFEMIASNFEGNSGLQKGGAIYNHRFAVPSLVERTTFNENDADQGGAIYNHSEEGLKVISSLFVANQATDKGGAIFNNRFIAIANTTFVRNTNTALIMSETARSEYNHCETNIFNSIFYLNTAKIGGYRVDIHSENLNRDLSTQDVRRNILQEYTGTTNQVNVDPLFINNTDDFRLQTASPAIDAGRVALFNEISDVNAGATTDLGGNLRNQGANIDIGAYEIDPSTIAIPTCTTITTPTDGATDVALDTEITWNAVADAISYRIYIGTSAGGTDVINGEEVTGTSYTPAIDWEENTTYYVTVVPYNTAGEAQDCPEISFTITTLLAAPECTTITSPANGDADIGLDAGITWTAVDGADGYRISIGTISGGTDIVDGEEVTGASYTPTDWEENTTYYVTVVPFNAAGEAEDCAEVSFTTTTLLVAPECSAIISPPDDATDVGLGAGIVWTAADGADGYRISIGTTSGGTDIVDGEEVIGTSYTPAIDWEENTTYYVTVVPYNAAGEAEDCAVVSFTTTTLLVAPGCSAITSPDNDAIEVGLGAGITWTAVDGADGYHISIGTTSGGTDIVNGEEVIGTSYTPAIDWEENTTYYVTVVPFNAAGEAEDCAVVSFTTTTLLVAPECTAITSPENDAIEVGLGAGITWTAVDGADGYRISIGKTSGGTDIVNGEEVTGTSYTPAIDWEENTTYYVTVVPYNTAGEAQDCPEISFTTTTLLAAPECTTITSPANGDADIGLDAGITWTAVDGADGYRISIGTISGGTDIVDGEEVTGTSYTPATDWEENTTYYVTVVPFNAAGEAEDCAEVSFTTTTLLVAPECSAIISPPDDATDVGLGAGITWTAVDGADGYRISIGTTSGGTDIVNGEEVTGTSYTPAIDWEENTTYYVTVVPYNAAGEAEDCAVVSFTTTTLLVAPGCSAITSPDNDAIEVGLGAGITWTAVDGADGYRISIGTTSGGTDIVNGEEVTGTSYTPAIDWEENTTYYVTVVPYNTAGEAQDCPEISFTTTTLLVAPECSAITSPTDDATDVGLDAGITWTAVDGADGYRISIGTTFGGTDIVDGEEVTGTSYTPATDWEENTTYYVTVVPYNTAGEAQDCSEISFTTTTLLAAPECTTITSPANGDADIGLDAGITWRAVDGAYGYRISIGTISGGTNIVDGKEVAGTGYAPATDWEENTTYYVTVVPYNAAGEAEDCAVVSFTTTTLLVAPECTTVITPADGASSSALDAGIRWRPVETAEGYRITIGTTPGEMDVVDSTIVTGTLLNPMVDFVENTPYYLSVIPFNAAGEATGCPQIRFIIIPNDNQTDKDINRTKYGLSPNGDGANDFWKIDGIERYPNNTVFVYNRWGDMVFEMRQYDNHSRVFTGMANRSTRLGAGVLPAGTYFFTIQYRDNLETKKIEGFLVLKR